MRTEKGYARAEKSYTSRGITHTEGREYCDEVDGYVGPGAGRKGIQ